MRINHNIAALNTYNKLSANTAATAKSLEKLSSGLKINKAGDNAAGLAISEKMRGQIRGLDQASTNASDAISLINTAEGALSETHSILQRMRELAVQSANDTNVTVDRSEIQKEMNQLTSEINRIGNTTEFNTQKLLDGTKKVIGDTGAKTVGNTALANNVTIHANEAFSSVKGSAITFNTASSNIGYSITSALTFTSGTTVASGTNELTLTVNGTQATIVVAAGTSGADLLSGLNDELSGAFGSGVVTASIEGGKLKLTATGGSASNITIDGAGMADLLFGANRATTMTQINGVNSGTQYLSIHDVSSASATGSGAFVSGTTVASGTNEMTLTVNGTQKTITVDAGLSGADLLSGLNDALSGAFGSGVVSASVNAAGNLELRTVAGGANQSISIDGGGMAAVIFGANALTSGMTYVAGQDANNTLTFNALGSGQTLTIASNNYRTAAELAQAVQDAIDAEGLSGSIEASISSGKLVLASLSDAATLSTFSGNATTSIGFTNPVTTSGYDTNNTLTLSVDGGAAKTITLSGGTYATPSGLVSALQTKIDAEVGANKVKVSLESGKLAINTVSTEGSGSTIAITGATEFFKAVGFIGSGVNVAGEEGTGSSLAFQIGANTAQSMSIQIEDMRSAALKISTKQSGGAEVTAKDGVTKASYVSVANVNDGTTDNLEEYALDVSTHEKATAAISILDDAIQSVSAERSKMGSYQNRLEHTINNLGTSSENLSAAESRIRDVDMAKEMMEFTKNNILSQAAQSMLAQANQQPQGVLQLLQ